MRIVRIVCGLLVMATVCPAASLGSESSAADARRKYAKDKTPAPEAVAPTEGKPVTLAFNRRSEPKEQAFSFLAPPDWALEGGMFHVNPAQTGGSTNSISAKCDLTLKKDAEGTVFFRWLPTWTFADMSRNPQFSYTAAMFPPGSQYQGMTVRPMPGVNQFLQELFRQIHPQATDARLVEFTPMPELGEVFRKIYKAADESQQAMGFPPFGYDGGGILVEYTEGQRPYREVLSVCLVDMRASGAMWSNQYTLAMRAPASEALTWKPVFDIIRQSMKLNPEWFARAYQADAERARLAQETMRYIQNIDREIYAHRAKTNAEIRHESYLWLNAQNEYVNPFNGQTEQDTDQFKYRWTTEQGDMIYTDRADFNPNTTRPYNDRTWKLTPVRPR
ncbi:MAG: hypothetical protein RBR19_17470 [Sedimentisphaerales bacterium]|nr:hypothetical protein [Sedimentisphaerales bacterium]